MVDDIEDEIRPSHFRYARRDTSSKAVAPTPISVTRRCSRRGFRISRRTRGRVRRTQHHGRRLSDFFDRAQSQLRTGRGSMDGPCAPSKAPRRSSASFAGLDKNPGRVAPLALGLSLLSWTLGDVFLTIESLGGKTPRCRRSPTSSTSASTRWPTWRPCSYCAPRWVDCRRPNWLDGVVAGLGAAAICARVRVPQHRARGRWQRRGGGDEPGLPDRRPPVALARDRRHGAAVRSIDVAWFLLAAGISLNVIGDTANLFSSSTIFASRLGVEFNAVRVARVDRSHVDVGMVEAANARSTASTERRRRGAAEPGGRERIWRFS